MFLPSCKRPTLVNISFNKNWELENEKKIGVLMFQKVAKTGNIGKKDYWLPSNSFVPLIHFFFFCIQIIGIYLGKCGIVYGTCVSAQVFNFGVSHPQMIIRYYFLTRSGYLSVFLFTRDNMLMWASDWLIANSRFSWSVFLWCCINFLRYRAASDPNQRHVDLTEEIRRLVMTCCKLYLLSDIR